MHETIALFHKPTLDDFRQFVIRHKKPYVANSTELAARYQVFKDNALEAYRKNAKHVQEDQVYGINKFSDLTPEEFKAQYLSDLTHVFPTNNTQSCHRGEKSLSQLPKFVDWRSRGVITDVGNQGQCGACWAFSAVETMESMFAINNKKAVPHLSVQQLIDCDHKNNGCDGGNIMEACNWAQQYGVVPASTYPLTDHTDRCRNIKPTVPRVRVNDFSVSNCSLNEKELLSSLASHGPVSVAVDAMTWHNYVGGIIRFHCSTHTNHAVQIVGYNLTGDIPYYIVRNSWGTDFGDNGYLYIKYGENLCGIATEVISLNVAV